MKPRYSGKSNNTFIFVVVGLLILAVAIVLGIRFWLQQDRAKEPKRISRTVPQVLPKDAETTKQPDALSQNAPPTVDFNRLKKDRNYREKMEERKSRFGLDKSVDLIVKSDERIKIGEKTIPMAEILEKIRINKEGGVIEKDLTGDAEALKRKRLIEKLDAYEKKFRELQHALESISKEESGKTSEDAVREYSRLSGLVDTYRRYKKDRDDAEANQALLSKDDEEIEKTLKRDVETLRREGDRIEKELCKKMIPDKCDHPDEHDRDMLFEKLEAARRRFREIDDMIKTGEVTDQPDKFRQLIEERKTLEEAVQSYENYLEIQEAIKEKTDLLASGKKGLRTKVRERAVTRKESIARLESELFTQVFPGEAEEIYGIYVVRPGDNVWNIHFTFLKEYFGKKGIRVLPMEDEPLANGNSSGIGKILKFSENMVYIFNIRENKLGVDLNLIHPLSKIVVFNMGRALALLSRIDYGRINEVRFDGETLWLPRGS